MIDSHATEEKDKCTTLIKANFDFKMIDNNKISSK